MLLNSRLDICLIISFYLCLFHSSWMGDMFLYHCPPLWRTEAEPNVEYSRMKCNKMSRNGFWNLFLSAITVLLSIQPCGPLITQGLKVVIDYFNLFHAVCIFSMHLSGYSTSPWRLRLFWRKSVVIFCDSGFISWYYSTTYLGYFSHPVSKYRLNKYFIVWWISQLQSMILD